MKTSFYKRSVDRKRAITLLRKSGFNYFADFKDTYKGYGLQYAKITRR
jgi:hypothetical protein